MKYILTNWELDTICLCAIIIINIIIFFNILKDDLTLNLYATTKIDIKKNIKRMPDEEP